MENRLNGNCVSMTRRKKKEVSTGFELPGKRRLPHTFPRPEKHIMDARPSQITLLESDGGFTGSNCGSAFPAGRFPSPTNNWLLTRAVLVADRRKGCGMSVRAMSHNVTCCVRTQDICRN